MFSKQLYYITLFLALQENERGAGKFFPKYSDNQKWVAHNMLRPSSVAIRRQLPPEGKAISKAIIKISNGFVWVACFSTAPHQSTSLTASPRGEALKQGWTFFRIFALSKNEKGEAYEIG